MAHLGVRVVRGPDWDADDEDGGEGHVGTVIELLSNQRVLVLWDTGQESTCRAGTDGKFDLRVFDTAQVGVRHSGTKCAECGEENILGMLWRCADCPGYELCTLCYNDDKHDLRHQFVRIDTPSKKGEVLKKRKISVRVRTLGTFPGAKVTRGRHWEWNDQDGGPGSEGEVIGYEQAAPDSSRNLVRVQWSHSGAPNIYRLGFLGHVDLTCVEEEDGPFYYRNHLPPFDIASSTETESSGAAEAPPVADVFKDDTLTVENVSGTLASDADGSGVTATAGSGNTPSHEKSTSGDTFQNRDTDDEDQTSDEIVRVSSSGSGEDRREQSNVDAGSGQKGSLSVMVGDLVAIKVREDRLRELQTSHGGCQPNLLKVVGMTGKVTGISGQGAVSVQFLSDCYTLNPEALVKVEELNEGNTVRIRPDEDEVKILNSRVGWKQEMDATIGKFGRVLKIDADGDALVGFGRQFFMFSPACCLPAPDAKPDSLILPVASVQRSREIPNNQEKPAEDSKKENVQDLYRMIRERVLSDTGTSGNPDVRELLSAIELGDHVTVRNLCQADKSIADGEHKGLTPLMFALGKRKREIVEILLEFGADVNHCVLPEKTPLGAALEGKRDDLVELLLDRGSHPFFLDPRGHNYLHNAAFFNLPGSVRVLAAHGVDVNHKDDFGDTPLHMAIDQRMNEAVEALVSLDSLDFSVRNKRGHPPLHAACVRGNPRAVELILARDKSQLRVFTHGSSPLHIAAQNDHDDCIRILVLNGGADVNLQPWEGSLYTPLHLACIRGKFCAAEALVELGADIQLKDRDGDTALHLSIGGRVVRDLECEVGRQECQMRVAMACMLISRGAYVDAENNKGRNPLSYGVRQVKDGVRQFVKHNPKLVKKQGARNSVDEIKSLGLYASQGAGQGELKEALKGVGLPCGLCGTPKSDVTLQPCQHKCVCSTCSDKVTRCPLCEENVTEKIVTGPDEQTVDLDQCKQM